MNTKDMRKLNTGEYVDPQDWGQLVHLATEAFKNICTTHGVWPGEIHKKKTQAIARAREDFVQAIRRQVWCRRAMGDCRDRILLLHFGNDPPARYRSVSYPILALLLGCDHSALVLANQRAEAREGHACESATTEDHTPKAERSPGSNSSIRQMRTTRIETTADPEPEATCQGRQDAAVTQPE